MFKNKIRVLSLLLTVFLLVFTVSSVFAAPPLSVHIEVDEILSLNGEPFAASGPAVDDGLVCATGTMEDLSIEVINAQGNSPYTIIRVYKRFSCDDQSGTFDIKMIVHLDKTSNETTAKWRVVGGTNNYVNLHGTGSLVGTPIVIGESITDIYDGQMH